MATHVKTGLAEATPRTPLKAASQGAAKTPVKALSTERVLIVVGVISGVGSFLCYYYGVGTISVASLGTFGVVTITPGIIIAIRNMRDTGPSHRSNPNNRTPNSRRREPAHQSSHTKSKPNVVWSAGKSQTTVLSPEAQHILPATASKTPQSEKVAKASNLYPVLGQVVQNGISREKSGLVSLPSPKSSVAVRLDFDSVRIETETPTQDPLETNWDEVNRLLEESRKTCDMAKALVQAMPQHGLITLSTWEDYLKFAYQQQDSARIIELLNKVPAPLKKDAYKIALCAAVETGNGMLVQTTLNIDHEFVEREIAPALFIASEMGYFSIVAILLLGRTISGQNLAKAISLTSDEDTTSVLQQVYRAASKKEKELAQKEMEQEGDHDFLHEVRRTTIMGSDSRRNTHQMLTLRSQLLAQNEADSHVLSSSSALVLYGKSPSKLASQAVHSEAVTEPLNVGFDLGISEDPDSGMSSVFAAEIAGKMSRPPSLGEHANLNPFKLPTVRQGSTEFVPVELPPVDFDKLFG